MTHQRRTAHTTRKSPARTGGEDRPAPACAGNFEPYSILMDHKNGEEFDYALKAAQGLCGSCPLVETCLFPAAKRGEQWARAIVKPTKPKRSRGPAKCGTHSGWASHRKRGEDVCEPCRQARNKYMRDRRKTAAEKKHDTWAAEVRHLDLMGLGISQVCRELDTNRDALWKRCKAHGLLDVYKRFTGRERAGQNQHVRREDAA